MAEEEGPQAPAPLGAQDPPAPQKPPPPPAAQNPLPPQNPQIPMVPNTPHAPEVLHLPAPHMPPLHWSPFKPEYSGKPDKDAEAHLGQTTGWTQTDFKTMLRYRDSV